MSISRRKDGRWCVKYKIDTPTGPKWVQRSFSKDKEEEAKAFDAEAKYDESENSRPTLLECVLAYVREVPHCAKTTRLYEYLVCGHDRKDGSHSTGPGEFLAGKYADLLDKRDLYAFRDNCRASGACSATVALQESKLKAALTWCAGEDLIPQNPWGKYSIRNVQHKSHKGTIEDFRRVYAELPEWAQWTCRTVMALFLRPGESETFGLTWSAFDFRAGTATVYMGKVKASKTVYPPEDYMAEAEARCKTAGSRPDGLVCVGSRGQRIKEPVFFGVWRRARIRAGVASLAPYAMRHIMASEALAAGADLAAVAAQLGHRNITTTGRYYVHALPSAQRAVAKALPICTTLGADGAESGKKEEQFQSVNPETPPPAGRTAPSACTADPPRPRSRSQKNGKAAIS